jgi:hypothetical protein
VLGRRHSRSPLRGVGGIRSGLSGTGGHARGGVHVGRSAACNAGAASSSILACGMGSSQTIVENRRTSFLGEALSARLGFTRPPSVAQLLPLTRRGLPAQAPRGGRR